MRAFRITILLLLLCPVGAALAGIRIQQAQSLRRIQQFRLQQLALRGLVHEQQLQIARLRAPEQIKHRIERLQLQVYAPQDINSFTEAHHAKELALAGN